MLRSLPTACVLICILTLAFTESAHGKAAESCKEADIKKECSGLTAGDVNTKEKCGTACNECLGGNWGCPDFKIGKNATTFKCDCSKKQSGTCKYNNYDGICKDPGYEVATAHILRASRAWSLSIAAFGVALAMLSGSF